MSRIREFGKVYEWGSERPAVALARARQRKEKLLKEIAAVRERKRQEEEKETLAISEKVKEAELVIAMVIRHQAKRALKYRKGRARDYSEAKSPNVRSQRSGASTTKAQKASAILHLADQRVEPLHPSEVIVENAMPLPSDKRFVRADQTTCPFERGANSNNDTKPLLASLPSTPITIAEPRSVRLPYKGLGSLMSHPDRLQNATTEVELLKLDPGVRLDSGKSSASQNEVSHPSHAHSVERPDRAERGAEYSALREIQSLRKRKRELEEALNNLYNRYDGGQSEWPFAAQSEEERLEQELNAISNILDRALSS